MTDHADILTAVNAVEGRPCRSESGVIASNGDLWGLIHRGRIIGPAIFI